MSWIIALLLLAGAGFVLIAAIGLVRLPDLYTRMHAAAKAGALGGSLLFLACALAFREWAVLVEVLLIILFFYLTAPIAGQMIGRAGYLTRVKRCPTTCRDDLDGRYDLRQGRLHGEPPS